MKFDRYEMTLSRLFGFDAPQTEADSIELEEAVVDSAITPGKPGRVKYRGSWWSARTESNVTLNPEDTVVVVGRKNITLLVDPLPQQA